MIMSVWWIMEGVSNFVTTLLGVFFVIVMMAIVSTSCHFHSAMVGYNISILHDYII